MNPGLTRIAAAVNSLQVILPLGFVACGALADENLPIPAADLSEVKDAVPQRRAEFVAGRWCAHRALQAMGLPALKLPLGPLGAPCWPPGALGTITHDAGYCLAVAGPASGLRGIGVDWCEDGSADSLLDTSKYVLAPAEYDALMCSHDPARHLQLIFCAKEAVVKAVSATIGQFVDLSDIAIESRNSGFVAYVTGLDTLVQGVHLPVRSHALAWAMLV